MSFSPPGPLFNARFDRFPGFLIWYFQARYKFRVPAHKLQRVQFDIARRRQVLLLVLQLLLLTIHSRLSLPPITSSTLVLCLWGSKVRLGYPESLEKLTKMRFSVFELVSDSVSALFPGSGRISSRRSLTSDPATASIPDPSSRAADRRKPVASARAVSSSRPLPRVRPRSVERRLAVCNWHRYALILVP